MNTSNNQPAWLPKDVETTLQAPDWLVAHRQQHWDAFLQSGLPTHKNERWKYADLSFVANKKLVPASKCPAHSLSDVIHQHRLQRDESILLVMVNGCFMPELSDLGKLPHAVIVCSMKEAFAAHTALIEAHWLAHHHALEAQTYPFASLNAAMFSDGLFLYVPEKMTLSHPIHLLSLEMGDQEWIAHPFHLYILSELSAVSVIEEHFSLADHFYMKNIVSSIAVGAHATFEHVKIQNEGRSAAHFAHTFIHQQSDSRVSWVNCSFGSAFARDEVRANLAGTGAECHTAGFYRLSNDHQYIDNHVDIYHLAQNSRSDMLYKGILDQRSRAVFNGRLYVEKEAQKIVAYQANHHLLLSQDAEIYSKPELEIYADEVQCKHGATTGQLDEAALFYLRSRGIAREDAINMLLHGFAEEVLQRIKHAGAKLRALEWL